MLTVAMENTGGKNQIINVNDRFIYAADNSECVDVQICKQVYVSFYLLFFINIGEETEDFNGGNMKIYSKGIQEG